MKLPHDRVPRHDLGQERHEIRRLFVLLVRIDGSMSRQLDHFVNHVDLVSHDVSRRTNVL